MKPWVEREVTRWRGDDVVHDPDFIARETPVLLSYNGESHAVMLATPQDLEDFALGFSLGENIVRDRSEIETITILDHPEGIEIRMTIPDERFRARAGQQRLIAGRTGCGLCGVRTLEQAVRYPAPVGVGLTLSAAALQRALAALPETQEINLKTGSVHAAAWADTQGKILAVREDVGRHNALDKLIGHLARQAIDPASGFILVTSRASYEMVQKAAAFGVSFLAAVSAPTSLAVRMAEMARMTLIGFARPGSHTIYAHPQRVTEEEKEGIMNIEHLVQMANDIGNFFKSETVHAEAVGGIANHIMKFWEPRMRRQIIEHEKSGGAGLEGLVREAVRSLPA